MSHCGCPTCSCTAWNNVMIAKETLDRDAKGIKF